MSKRPQYTKFTSPLGVAKFPKLNTPDTKFKSEGEYSVKLLVPADEAQPLIEKIDAEIEKAAAEERARLIKDGKAGKAKALKMADKPYREDADDTGEPTGKVQFSFKAKASYVDKNTQETKKLQPPSLFDAKGAPLATRPDVWGGSLLRCAGEIVPFATAIGIGASLRLNAVKIIELRSGGSRDASDYGFEGDEGEFTGTDEKPAAPADEAAEDDEAGDAPNF